MAHFPSPQTQLVRYKLQLCEVRRRQTNHHAELGAAERVAFAKMVSNTASDRSGNLK
jgi:hypothetical protein